MVVVRRMSRTMLEVAVEAVIAVHGRAVVPDHEVVLCPAMDVDELRLRRVFHQVADEGHGLRLGANRRWRRCGPTGAETCGPFTGCVRTSRCSTGFMLWRSSSVKLVKPSWPRE